MKRLITGDIDIWSIVKAGVDVSTIPIGIELFTWLNLFVNKQTEKKNLNSLRVVYYSPMVDFDKYYTVNGKVEGCLT